MRKWCVWLCFPLALFGSALEGLSLEKALSLLQTNNPQLIVSRLEEQIRLTEEEAAKAGAWGSVDFVHTAARSNDALNVFGFKLQSREATFKDFGFADFDMANPNVLHVKPSDLNHPKARNHFRTGIQAQLPLYAGGRIGYAKQMAASLRTMSHLDTQALLASQTLELKRSFYALALLEEQATTLNNLFKATQSLHQTALAMHQEGYATPTDALEVQARLAEVTRTQEDIEVTQAFLLHYLSFLLHQEVRSVDTSVPALEPPSLLPAQTLAVQKARLGADLGALGVKLHEASFLPTLGLMGEYMWNGDRFGEFDKDAYTVGLEFRWNLFQGGSHSHALEGARLKHLQSRHTVILAEQAARLEAAQLTTELARFEAHIQSLQTQTTLHQRLLDHHTGRYQENLASMNDVLVRQAQLFVSIMELNEAKNNRLSTLLALEKLAYGAFQ